MVIKTTRQYPSTCDCIYEYTWDTDDPEDTRTHTFSSIVQKCAFHTALSDLDAYTHALENNTRVGKFMRQALTSLPTQLSQTLANGAIILKDGIELSWSYSGSGTSRVLTVSFTGVTLTGAQKNALQTACNTLFGVGKVTVA